MASQGMILPSYLVFKTMVFAFETHLESRQIAKTRESQIPKGAEELVTQAEFDAARAYQADKRAFSRFKGKFDFIVELIMIFYVTPWVWFEVQKRYGGEATLEQEINCSMIWLLIMHLINTFLGIGFSWYSDFVIEAKHGFNKKTRRLFVCDTIKMQIIALVIGYLFIPRLITIVRKGGDFFYLYVWLFVQAVMLFLMFIIPNWIMPLFYKLGPLQDQDLKAKIENLSQTVSFPLKNLYQIDGSTRSSHSNAFMYGFWKNKRIVIYDTLLDQCSHRQILAVLAHELGHWLYSHTIVNLVVSCVHSFAVFYLYSKVMDSKPLFEAFFYPDTNAVIIGLMLFQYILSPVETVLSLALTMLSRRNEFQADENAVAMGYGQDLKDALKIISKENKGDLNPDPWFAWFHFSHPSLIERLEAIDGKKNKYLEKNKTQ